MSYELQVTIKRDTIFGRGDGVAGFVDAEVEHDEYGLPYLRGRALKGMLVYECADILFALRQSQTINMVDWQEAARFLFGESGGLLEQEAQMEVGNACLPDELRAALADAVNTDAATAGQLRHDVLNGLTTIRRQTAVGDDGVAQDKSLRTLRLIQRETTFTAPLRFATPPGSKAMGLLAACVKGFRRGGSGRNRGAGLLEATLLKDEQVVDWFKTFKMEVLQ